MAIISETKTSFKFTFQLVEVFFCLLTDDKIIHETKNAKIKITQNKKGIMNPTAMPA